MKKTRIGFTVIELVVVMAIIGMLAAIIVPAIQEAREAARRTQCVSRLHNLGIAYHHRRSAFPDKSTITSPGNWINELSVYAEGREKIFLCPNDTDPSSVSPSGIVFHVRPNDWDIPFDPSGPRCQVSGWVASNYGGAYGLEFEDAYDWDFNDQRFVVETLPNGVRVQSVYKSAANKHDVKDATGHVWIFDSHPFKEAIIAAGGRSSFGINGHVHRFNERDATKVLLIEYAKIVANVVAPDGTDVWHDQVAPRHGGVFNVLFGDGHVVTMSPGDVDPDVSALHDKFWLPHIEH